MSKPNVKQNPSSASIGAANSKNMKRWAAQSLNKSLREASKNVKRSMAERRASNG